MTPREKQSAQTFAKILRSARKSSGVTQVLMAQRLGITQGTLSKLESGLLIPSTPQWFEFCEFTQIPDRSFVLGYIDCLKDHEKKAQPRDCASEGLFRLPKRYSVHRAVVVRGVLPLIRYLENRLGVQPFADYLSSKGVDVDYFVNLNHQINSQFVYDVIEDMMQLGYLDSRSLEEIFIGVSQGSLHGFLQDYYDQSVSQKDLFLRAFRKLHHYEMSFSAHVESVGSKLIDLALKPKSFMSDFEWTKPVGHMACGLRMSYLTEFSQYSGYARAKIDQSECFYEGDSQCVYRIHVS